jgi:hypothetical protein
MFRTFDPATILDVGEERKVTFEVKGINAGNATVTYDVHANIGQANLFPTGETTTEIGSPVDAV